MHDLILGSGTFINENKINRIYQIALTNILQIR